MDRRSRSTSRLRCSRRSTPFLRGAETAGAFGPDILIPPTGSASARQAVFETQDEYYSSDRFSSRSYFGLPPADATPIGNIGSHDEAIGDVDADPTREARYAVNYSEPVGLRPTSTSPWPTSPRTRSGLRHGAGGLVERLRRLHLRGSIEGEEVPSIMACLTSKRRSGPEGPGTIVVSWRRRRERPGDRVRLRAIVPRLLTQCLGRRRDERLRLEWHGRARTRSSARLMYSVASLHGAATRAPTATLAGRRQLFCASGRHAAATGGRLLEGRLGASDVALAGKDFEVAIGDVLYLVTARQRAPGRGHARAPAPVGSGRKSPVGLVNPTLSASSGSFPTT